MKRQTILLLFIAVLLGSGLGGLMLPIAAPDQALADDDGDGKGRDSDHDGDSDRDRDDDHDDDRNDDSGDRSGSGRRASPGKADLPWRPGMWRLFDDGSSEHLADGRYERRDRNGRLIEKRSAVPADRERLGRIRRNDKVELRVEVRGNRLTITDRAGWREEFRNGAYRLTDPRGNVVANRPATAADIARIRQALRE